MKNKQWLMFSLVNTIALKGKIFGAVYKKKDGQITKINGRFGVRKHLKGGTRTVPQDMYVVWDNNRRRYTALDPERIQSINYKGITYGFLDAE